MHLLISHTKHLWLSFSLAVDCLFKISNVEKSSLDFFVVSWCPPLTPLMPFSNWSHSSSLSTSTLKHLTYLACFVFSDTCRPVLLVTHTIILSLYFLPFLFCLPSSHTPQRTHVKWQCPFFTLTSVHVVVLCCCFPSSPSLVKPAPLHPRPCHTDPRYWQLHSVKEEAPAPSPGTQTHAFRPPYPAVIHPSL